MLVGGTRRAHLPPDQTVDHLENYHRIACSAVSVHDEPANVSIKLHTTTCQMKSGLFGTDRSPLQLDLLNITGRLPLDYDCYRRGGVVATAIFNDCHSAARGASGHRLPSALRVPG